MRYLLSGAICAVLLAGCGSGGGGGGSSAPTLPSTPIATATPASAPIGQQSVQRQVVNQALSSVKGSAMSAQFGAPGAPGALSFRRQINAISTRLTSAYARGERATSATRGRQSVTFSACSNALESAVVAVSPTEEQLYERDFYDAACTRIKEDAFFDITVTSATAGTGSGTVTLYTYAGQPYDYENLALTISGIGTSATAFAILATDAPSSGAPITAKVGLACGASTSALTCGIGAAARESSIGSDIGAVLAINAAATTNAATGVTTVPVSGSGAAYTGAIGSLDVVPLTASPWWTITGGSQVDAVVYNGTFDVAPGGTIQSGTLALTDAADDGTVKLTAAGSPAAISGVVTRTSTGTQLATFTVDIAGNGTVTYANGAVATVTNWIVYG